MNEIDFRNAMEAAGRNRKVIGDMICRIKRVEKELGWIDIDEEYENDRCQHLLSLFVNTGRNARMQEYRTSLPIGKYTLNNYRHAIRVYADFMAARSSDAVDKG